MTTKKVSTGGYIEIFEEPASRRFRYESEGRSAPLEGSKTMREAKSFPKIRIMNFTGLATVIVSCVTADKPYRQHPHKLVGNHCVKGICHIPEFYTNSADPTILSFPELRIQNCKKSEIRERLQDRKRLNINPFDLSKYGKDNFKRNIHKLRLCFQVLISPNPKDPTIRTQFEPIVSKPIINTKGATEMKILDISDVFSPASGGKKIIILCNTVVKDDIEIQFYEEDAEERQIWRGRGEFEAHNVHRNAAIAFTTPKYDFKRESKTSNPPKIFVQVVRPSDNAQSNKVRFHYIFDDIDTITQKKQAKVNKVQELFESVGSTTQNIVASNISEEKVPQLEKQQVNFPQQLNLPEQRNLPQHHNERQQQTTIQHQQNLQWTLPHQHNIRQDDDLKQYPNVAQQQNLAQPNLLQAHNIAQKKLNLSHQQTHQYSLTQQYNHNALLQPIPQEEFNLLHQYDPQRQNNLPYEYNPQSNYYPHQNQQLPNNEELFELGAICLNYFGTRSSQNDCSQEDQVMTSANMELGQSQCFESFVKTGMHRIF